MSVATRSRTHQRPLNQRRHRAVHVTRRVIIPVRPADDESVIWSALGRGLGTLAVALFLMFIFRVIIVAAGGPRIP